MFKNNVFTIIDLFFKHYFYENRTDPVKNVYNKQIDTVKWMFIIIRCCKNDFSDNSTGAENTVLKPVLALPLNDGRCETNAALWNDWISLVITNNQP